MIVAPRKYFWPSAVRARPLTCGWIVGVVVTGLVFQILFATGVMHP